MPQFARLIILPVLFAGCHRASVPAPSPEILEAVAACPAPSIDTRGWQIVVDSTGVRYRLPAEFVERPSSSPSWRRWDLAGDFQQSVEIGVIESPDYWISLRRAPSPGMHEMSECIDSIPGRQVLVQAWRMEGGAFRRGRRLDKYEVFALTPMEPGRTVLLTGGGSDRQTQALLLAIVRTIRVPSP
ncbi:MAG: hypothetical protein OEZ42_09180 [Gemmatimonadota bacterium]|nr:hypothetical protein [Gemmatimonadota bacterium]